MRACNHGSGSGAPCRCDWMPIAAEGIFGCCTTYDHDIVPTGCNNSSRVLRFHTMSGVLVVQSAPSGAGTCSGDVPNAAPRAGGATKCRNLLMSLPMADPTDPLPEPLRSTALSDSSSGSESGSGPAAHTERLAALLRACTGGLPVGDVRYAGPSCGGINYLLVQLGPGAVSRQQLEAVVPDRAAMLAAGEGCGLHGVILTAAAGEGAGWTPPKPCHSSSAGCCASTQQPCDGAPAGLHGSK